MAEATSKNIDVLHSSNSYNEILVTANMDTSDTITLDLKSKSLVDSSDNEDVTIESVSAHVKSTGVPLTFAYAGDVLTLSTTSITGADIVARVIYS